MYAYTVAQGLVHVLVARGDDPWSCANIIMKQAASIAIRTRRTVAGHQGQHWRLILPRWAVGGPAGTLLAGGTGELFERSLSDQDVWLSGLAGPG
jgi:hypothetical protein